MFNPLLVVVVVVGTAENYKVQTGDSKRNKYRIKETKAIQVSDKNEDLHIFGHLRLKFNVERKGRKANKQIFLKTFRDAQNYSAHGIDNK